MNPALWQTKNRGNLTVSGGKAPLLAKFGIAPVVGLIFVLAVGSMVWLDLAYGIAISLAFPKLLVAVLA